MSRLAYMDLRGVRVYNRGEKLELTPSPLIFLKRTILGWEEARKVLLQNNIKNLQCQYKYVFVVVG